MIPFPSIEFILAVGGVSVVYLFGYFMGLRSTIRNTGAQVYAGPDESPYRDGGAEVLNTPDRDPIRDE